MPDVQDLFQQHQAPRLHIASSLYSVKVHSTSEIGGVELDVVVAGEDVGVDQLCDLLAESVEHRQGKI